MGFARPSRGRKTRCGTDEMYQLREIRVEPTSCCIGTHKSLGASVRMFGVFECSNATAAREGMSGDFSVVKAPTSQLHSPSPSHCSHYSLPLPRPQTSTLSLSLLPLLSPSTTNLPHYSSDQAVPRWLVGSRCIVPGGRASSSAITRLR